MRGGDVQFRLKDFAGLISIHAPSCEGATQLPDGQTISAIISIHAPSCEGATDEADREAKASP